MRVANFLGLLAGQRHRAIIGHGCCNRSGTR
jgi:hypothetical protein